MKKFSLSSEELKKALKKVGQVVNNSTVLPVLKNIYCRVSGSQVEIIATDLEVTIMYRCELAHVMGDAFELLLPFEFVNKVLSVAGNEPIMFELKKTACIIHIEDGNFNTGALDNVMDFPKLPETPEENKLVMDEHFISKISTALPTASKDQLRPSMTRVLVDMQKESTYVVSTDAHALYRYKINTVAAAPQQIQFNAKMIKAIEDLTNVTLSWTKERVALVSDKITVWCQRFEDRYPDYNLVIPNNTANLQITKQHVVDAMHKALIAGNHHNQVNILPKKELGAIHYQAENADNGRNVDGRIAGDYSGDVESIALNAKKMLTVMAQVDANKISLHIHNAKKAVLISTEEDENYLGLLMPLMV